jgi:hypothetical protein
MTLIMGLFNTPSEAQGALDELARRGFTQPGDEVDVVSDQAVDEKYTDLEQHPETNVPGSVSSLGAPTPPQGYHTMFSGRFREAYLNGGVDELRHALSGEGVGDSTIRRIAEAVERGGALVAVRASQERIDEATDVLRRTKAQVLA